jgi:hypothetical protein
VLCESCSEHPSSSGPVVVSYGWLQYVAGSLQAVRRRLSLIRPEVLVASCTSAARSPSRHAAEISASFSFSAGESSTTDGVRRDGRLVELTERDVGRDPEREGLREAIAAPASRARLHDEQQQFTRQAGCSSRRRWKCYVSAITWRWRSSSQPRPQQRTLEPC